MVSGVIKGRERKMLEWEGVADVRSWFSENSCFPRVRLASARRCSFLALPCFLGRCNLYTNAIFPCCNLLEMPLVLHREP